MSNDRPKKGPKKGGKVVDKTHVSCYNYKNLINGGGSFVMKRRLFAVALVVMLLVAAVPASATTYLSIATGGTQGTYYALGGDIANLLSKEIADVDITAQATGGSVENIRLISQREAELGTVQNDVATYAFNGVEAFEGEQITNFGVIGNLYPEVVQLVFSDESGIKTLEDLKGKRVSIGAAGSGVYQNAIDFLTIAGLTLDDIDEQLLSFGESTDAIKNRQIDAAFVTAGIPNPGVTDLASTHDIELMSLSDEVVDKLCADHPYYTKFVIPASTYASQGSDAATVNISAIMIASSDMDEQLVYDITKTIYEKTAELTHAKRSEILIDNALAGFDAEMLHPGAARYYTELGLLN